MKLSAPLISTFLLLQNNAVTASDSEVDGATQAFISVCSAANPALLGRYIRDADPAQNIYHNEQGMSFFRNREFWYLGDVSKWPPETHYRCVDSEEVCNVGGDIPASSALGGWTVNKRVVKSNVPVEIVVGDCPDSGEAEL